MTSIRLIPPAVALMALAACATPTERCRVDATRDLATVRTLIAESRETLARGYTYERELERRPRLSFCLGQRRSNVGVSFCSGNRISVREVPVAVNLDEERATLRTLEAKERELETRARSELAACPAPRR